MSKASPNGIGQKAKTPLNLSQIAQNTQEIFCDPDLDNLEFYSATYIGYKAKTHSHMEYTLGVTDAGRRGYVQKGETIIAAPKSILLVNANTPHDGFPVDDKPWRCRAFYPDENIFRKYLGLGGPEIPFPHFPDMIIKDQKAYKQFDSFLKLVKTSRFPLEKQTAFVDLLETLVTLFSTTTIKSTEFLPGGDRAIEILKNFMKQNYSEKLSLDDLARVADFHPNYLVKIFQSKTGFTPHNYLMDIRLKKAKDILRQGKAAADVAIEVGFFDQSHMQNYFKAVLGMTPGQYQTALKNQPGSSKP